MSKIICGKNSVFDAIKNKVKIKKIYTTKTNFDFDLSSFDVDIKTKEELDKMTHLNHQGIIAIIENDFQYFSLNEVIKKKPNIILMLDHIEDVHNFGAILRTANAAGVNHIIIPDKRSVEVNDTVLKISSGGFINMQIAKVASLQSTIEKLKKEGYWIYSSILNEQAINYSHVQYNNPLVLVVGNESSGVSRTIEKASDQLIYIPMMGTVQSLNVSVATGILLFEISKKIK